MTTFDINVTTESPLTAGDGRPYPCIAPCVLDIDGGLAWFLVVDRERFQPRDTKRFSKLMIQLEQGQFSVGDFAEWARDERGLDLEEVTYGRVPTDFVQIEPDAGPPAELANDRRYALIVFGAQTMSMEFSVAAA